MHSTGNTDVPTVADTANRAATFESMKNEDERPTITVAGVHVALYVDPASRQVRVSSISTTPSRGCCATTRTARFHCASASRATSRSRADKPIARPSARARAFRAP